MGLKIGGTEMKKITTGDIFVLTFIVLFIIMFGFVVNQNVRLKQERQELKDKIQELNREIGEYRAMDSFWEDYMDLLDEIYQGKINEAVLEERVKWLEYNNIYDEGNKIEDLQEQIEMQSLYYELKMDYYEERYGVDLDATPEDFELYLYDNYRELYDYLVEEEMK